MTKIIISIALFISSLVAAQNVKLTISITGFDNNKGVVLVALYNSEGTFLRKSFKGVVSEIKNKEATITFMSIPKGEYAVSSYHDQNNNGKLDTNFIGIPKEDYASSNNAKGFMGPPKYKDAKFELDKDAIIKINYNN